MIEILDVDSKGHEAVDMWCCPDCKNSLLELTEDAGPLDEVTGDIYYLDPEPQPRDLRFQCVDCNLFVEAPSMDQERYEAVVEAQDIICDLIRDGKLMANPGPQSLNDDLRALEQVDILYPPVK